jgi:ABC-2 type transport system permease protein
MGVTSNEQEALDRLRRGEVDLVAVTPPNAYDTIRSNQRAIFTLYHHEIDPFQVDYVNYFGQVYIDEVNRRVLVSITEQGQKDAAEVKNDVRQARGNAATLRQALQTGDQATADRSQASLSNNVDAVSLALGASLGVLNGVQQTLGPGESGQAADILQSLNSVQENTDAMRSNGGSSGTGSSDNASQIERVSKIEADLAKLDDQLNEFTSISPDVIVRPFGSESKSIATLQPNASNFFAPAVVALLAVTLAALSIVRERTVGTMELFRVSPLSAGETLIGKYLSYMLFGAVITALLVLLMVFGLKVPMLGNWWNLALVMAVVLFTSLGIGFLISLISQTDTQAVQLTMIILLTSVFFSGFLMSLDMISKPVQVISWALPTTYGIVMLRDIFLRGALPNLLLLGGLAAIGIALMLLSWMMLRRLIQSR